MDLFSVSMHGDPEKSAITGGVVLSTTEARWIEVEKEGKTITFFFGSGHQAVEFGVKVFRAAVEVFEKDFDISPLARNAVKGYIEDMAHIVTGAGAEQHTQD